MAALGGSDIVRHWRTNNEYSARVGCGIIGSWVLPAWFVLVFLTLGPDQSRLALGFTLVLVIVVSIVSIAALVRVRGVCREVSQLDDGTMVFHGRPKRHVPPGGIESMLIGKGPGLDPVRLLTKQGSVRMPRDFDDFAELLASIEAHSPSVEITDERYR